MKTEKTFASSRRRPPIDKRRQLEGERLSGIIRELKIKKTQFAESIRISNAAISQMCRGQQVIQPYHLLGMEYVYDINENYIKTGKGDKFRRPGRILDVASELSGKAQNYYHDTSADFCIVPQIHHDLRSEPDANTPSSYAFRKAWLEERGNPEEMVLLEVPDQSMTPSLSKSDWVLVNRGTKQPKDRDLVLARIGTQLVLREAHMHPSELRLVSKDSSEPLVLDHDNVSVIEGVVVWVGRDL